MDMVASSVELAVRSIVMGTAGLWYFMRTSSCRQNFLHSSELVLALVNRSKWSEMSLPWTHVSAIDLLGKPQMYPLDIFGEDQSTGAESNGEEFGLQLAHALGERHHFSKLIRESCDVPEMFNCSTAGMTMGVASELPGTTRATLGTPELRICLASVSINANRRDSVRRASLRHHANID